MHIANVFGILRKSDTFALLSFFVVLIAIGTALLLAPGAWRDESAPLRLVDAAFMATSAICVTGLAAVNVSAFTLFGQVVILALVQIGALGIISFSSILTAVPNHRFSIGSRNTIQGFFLNGMEFNPKRIVRNIILLTIGAEIAGIAALYAVFTQARLENALYSAIFHGISSFCNAGLSIYDDSLYQFRENNAALIVMGTLITAGGIGFLVLHDIFRVVLKKKRRLSYHSLIVLWMTFVASLGMGLFYLAAEWGRAYGGLGLVPKIWNALFQSISARTAGFQTFAQASLSESSKMMTCVLMFVGGAPGSVSGGLKITTVFIIAAVMLRRPDIHGDIRIRHHRLSAQTINHAVVYFLKAVFMLLCLVMALLISETALATTQPGAGLLQIVFEAISAFATAGYSLDYTPSLSTAGKCLVICMMFAGRVGLVTLAFPSARHKNYPITYPEGELLL
jgi:trk system potassium uptake protein TrkH